MRRTDSYACATKTSGRLYCWGVNVSGQLGTGDLIGTSAPVEVWGGRTDWAAVWARDGNTCAKRTSGRLYCWGQNFYGQTGTGATGNSVLTPQPVGGTAVWTSVAVGLLHACGLRSTGRLYCWGRNTDGQLGDGTTVQRRTPAQVGGGSTAWTAVSTQSGASCARRSNGRLYCWGSSDDGRLGDGTSTPRLVPTQVAGARTDWASLSAGLRHVCARRTDGSVHCWGSNASRQLGDGTTIALRRSPVPLAGGARDWRTLTAGADHTCALTTAGRAYCWGANTSGQLGDGSPVGSGAAQNRPSEVYAP